MPQAAFKTIVSALTRIAAIVEVCVVHQLHAVGHLRMCQRFLPRRCAAVTSLLYVPGSISVPLSESVALFTVFFIDFFGAPASRFLLLSSGCTLPARRCLHVEVGGTEARNTRRQYDRLSKTHWRWFLQRVGVLYRWLATGHRGFPYRWLRYGKSFQHDRQSTLQDNICLEECRIVLELVVVKALVPPVGSLWAIRFLLDTHSVRSSPCLYWERDIQRVESGPSHIRWFLPTSQREYVEPTPACCRPFHGVQRSSFGSWCCLRLGR